MARTDQRQSSFFNRLLGMAPSVIGRVAARGKPTAASVLTQVDTGDLFDWAMGVSPAAPSDAYIKSAPTPKPPSEPKPTQPDLFVSTKPRRDADEPIRTGRDAVLPATPPDGVQGDHGSGKVLHGTWGVDSGGDSGPNRGIGGTEPPVGRLPEKPVGLERREIAGDGDRAAGPVRGAGGGGRLKEQAAANIDAIRIARDIGDGSPTEAEMAALKSYRGWGGIPAIFDESKSNWAELRDKLKSVTTDAEYAACRASTVNAHYTSPEVSRAIWKLVSDLGFRAGSALEPGCGKGQFLETIPEKLSVNATGVELDPVTARICKAIHGRDHTVVNSGFEDIKVREVYDISVGNVPFGDYSVRDVDGRYNGDGKASIHNHFIRKSLDMLKPGGLAVLLTSRYSLDSVDKSARISMAKTSNLVAAVRLPESAFKESANTEVVTDILVFRKRLQGELPNSTAWIDTVKVPVENGNATMNEYYVANKTHALGTFALARGMYRDGELTLLQHEDTPLSESLTAVFASIAERARETAQTFAAVPGESPAAAVAQPIGGMAVKEGAFTVVDGVLHKMEFGMLTEQHGVPDRDIPQVMAMAALRDAARSVLELQRRHWDGQGTPPWADAQEKLGMLYDGFVARYGYLNKVTIRNLPDGPDGEERSSRAYPNHIRAFKADPDAQFVYALEDMDESAGIGRKTDIFRQRVLAPERVVTSAASVSDALLVSLDEKGRVDIDRIAELVGMPPGQAAAELLAAKLVFRNPEAEGRHEEAGEYLSGNVRTKLAAARKAARKDPDTWSKNVAALEAVQPVDLIPTQIDAQLGAPFVASADIKAFVEETFGLYGVEIGYVASEGSWAVQSGKYGRTSVTCTETWGTHRRDALALVADALNQRLPEIWDEDSDGKRTKNVSETLRAREQMSKLAERFSKWIWEDDDRAARVCETYNRTFNSHVERRYDGRHLTLPGSSETIRLRPHQMDAVWRTMQSNTLLQHCVGAGKTFTSIASGMETRRISVGSSKPLYVVPTAMLEQFSREFLQLYPNASILVCDKDDIGTPDARKRFVARAAVGNWDGIIMTHSSFTKVGVSKELEERFMNDELSEHRETLEAAKKDGNNLTIKGIEKSIKRLEEKLESRLKLDEKDRGINIEEMGVTQLYLDESHIAKNLSYSTKIQGMGCAGSQRAMDLLLKIRHLETVNPGKCVTFMSATPISNSLSEMYTQLRFLNPKALKDRNCQHFDSFIAVYGRTTSTLELEPSGNGYRISTRIAKFANVPEMIGPGMYGSIADVQSADMLKLPVPAIKGGKPRTVIVPPSEQLIQFITSLGDRAEKVRSRRTDSSDNMLCICTDGRKAALDLRLVGINDQIAETKVTATAREIIRIHELTKNNLYLDRNGKPHPVKGALQMVFCDTSTPNADGRWNFYDALRDTLVDQGVPRNKACLSG